MEAFHQPFRRELGQGGSKTGGLSVLAGTVGARGAGAILPQGNSGGGSGLRGSTAAKRKVSSEGMESPKGKGPVAEDSKGECMVEGRTVTESGQAPALAVALHERGHAIMTVDNISLTGGTFKRQQHGNRIAVENAAGGRIRPGLNNDCEQGETIKNTEDADEYEGQEPDFDSEEEDELMIQATQMLARAEEGAAFMMAQEDEGSELQEEELV